METLWDWLTSLYAVMAVLPFLSFFVFWLILYGVSKKKNGDEAFSRYNYFSADRLRIFAVESSF
ncbi:hypothetical protein P7H16_21050 [Paenibacillus larvae]|nr:hypothetical protein [Paenibacillus larvae]MDT2248900.1 hypothetical protein [Paenibacillus larvae]MDT2265784.1 hypothetical protein [Paenibacillus larvae]